MSKGILAKRERNEFKPVIFNQGSAQVLGVKVYGLKRQWFGLVGNWGENCARVWVFSVFTAGMLQEHGSQVQGLSPPCSPLWSNVWGFCKPACCRAAKWCGVSATLARANAGLLRTRLSNRSTVCALKETLLVILTMRMCPETVAKSWRRSSIQGY